MKPKVLKRFHRKIDFKMQSVIVLCRFGQLKDFSLPLNSVYTVSQRTALPYTTVKRVLDNFKANNYKFVPQRKRG